MGTSDGLVTVWEVATGKRLFRLKGHTVRITGLNFSRDGQALASGSFDGLAKLWRLPPRSEGRILLEKQPTYLGLAYSPDGEWLATCGAPARLWHARNEKVERPLETTKRLAFSPDSKVLATGADDALIKLWDVPGGRLLRTLKGRPTASNRDLRMVGSIAFSTDGQLLAVGSGWPTMGLGNYDQIVQVWEVQSGREICALPHNNTITSLAFSPDGNTLAQPVTTTPYGSGRWQPGARYTNLYAPLLLRRWLSRPTAR